MTLQGWNFRVHAVESIEKLDIMVAASKKFQVTILFSD